VRAYVASHFPWTRRRRRAPYLTRPETVCSRSPRSGDDLFFGFAALARRLHELAAVGGSITSRAPPRRAETVASENVASLRRHPPRDRDDGRRHRTRAGARRRARDVVRSEVTTLERAYSTTNAASAR